MVPALPDLALTRHTPHFPSLVPALKFLWRRPCTVNTPLQPKLWRTVRGTLLYSGPCPASTESRPLAEEARMIAIGVARHELLCSRCGGTLNFNSVKFLHCLWVLHGKLDFSYGFRPSHPTECTFVSVDLA